mgnify:FL=1
MRKKYFVRAATSSGCVNLAESNFSGFEKSYVLKGNSKAVKTRIISAVGTYFEQKGLAVETVLSPFGPYLDGVTVPGIGLAVSDAEVYSGDGVILPAGEAECPRAEELLKKADGALGVLYSEYGEAKKIHDEWEKVYIKNMDFDSLNRFTEFEENLLIRPKKSGRGEKKERFFGASTPSGSVNYVANLTEGLAARYFIKGRPGTGKSTFLKKLAERAMASGYDVEVYYCSFDKESLDMVTVPELSFAVFDSTAPHELLPEGERDTVLDFYLEAHLSGIDERYESVLEPIKKRYALKTAEGRSALSLAMGYIAEAEYYLADEASFSGAIRIAEKIISEN